MNSLNLVGRLRKDVDINVTDNGVNVGKFTVAVNRPFAKGNNEQKADFLNCVAFNNIALNLGQYCKKGSLISLQGRVQSFSYNNEQGQKVFGMNIVADNIQYLEPKNKKEQYSQDQHQQFNDYSSIPSDQDLTDQDLPF